MVGTYFFGLLPSGAVALLLRFVIKNALRRAEGRGKPIGKVMAALLRAFPFAFAFAPTIVIAPPVGESLGIGIGLTATAAIPLCLFERWPIPPMHLHNISFAATSLLIVWALGAAVPLARYYVIKGEKL